MPTLITKFNWGSALENQNRLLTRQLDEAYTDIARVVNTKISKYILNGSDPLASSDANKNFEIGDIAVRTDTDAAWIMTSRTNSTNVTWTLIT